MNIAIVYDSSTGTTEQAAKAMGVLIEERGHRCSVEHVATADPAVVKDADLICVGGWVKGLFVIGQHPSEGVMRFIERLGSLDGKKVLAFCTYKLATGSTLPKMAKALAKNGANVVGQFKFRGAAPNGAFTQFVASLPGG